MGQKRAVQGSDDMKLDLLAAAFLHCFTALFLYCLLVTVPSTVNC